MFRRFPVPRSVVSLSWRTLARIPFVLFAFSALICSVAAKKKPPAGPINLNTATSDELQQVPGIGPVTAEKILRMRKAYGPFKSVDDLRAIKGIGPKRLEKMRKYLVAGKSASRPATRPSKPKPASVSPRAASPGRASQPLP